LLLLESLLASSTNPLSFLDPLGLINARSPSPRPRPRWRVPERNRGGHRDLSVDVYASKNRTEVEVDVHKHERSHSRRRQPAPDDDYFLVPRNDRNDLLRVQSHSHSHRRARSAGPFPSEVRQEAAAITDHINARGRMGEATRDWTLVDVPPGTERLRMQGAGGGGAEVTWQRYNGVRRAKFIPSTDSAHDGLPLEHETTPRDSRDRLSIQIHDRDRQVEVEKYKDRRVVRPATPQPEMWTEITRDLVSRRALDRRGYTYEATKYFFYVMDYLSQVSCFPYSFTPRKSDPAGAKATYSYTIL
jgi:hypothetical protein